MGRKRWLLAITILVVVLALIAFVFLQTGADTKLAQELKPRVEERFGVRITYDDVSVSLTTVAFDNVRIEDPKGGTFALVERLGVNFRVGPLLLGDLDITGMRIDGLKLLMGKKVGGADIPTWGALYGRLQSGKKANPNGPPKHPLIPEIYLSSGQIQFNNGHMTGSFEGLKGRITPGDKAHLQCGDWSVLAGKSTRMQGDEVVVDNDFSTRKIAVSVHTPRWAIPLERPTLNLAFKNLDATWRSIEKVLDRLKQTTSGGNGPGRRLTVVVTDGQGSLNSGDKEALVFSHVGAQLRSSQGQTTAFTAKGGLNGTNAQWAVQGKFAESGAGELVLEIPELPLFRVGPAIFDSGAIDWTGADADSNITLSYDGDAEWTASGQTSISGVGLDIPQVGAKLHKLAAAFDFKVNLDQDKQLLHMERVMISSGLARATVRGDLSLDHLGFDLQINVPKTACRHILGAIPDPLKGDIKDVSLAGNMALDLRVALDLLKPDEMKLDGHLDNQCRISDFGAVPTPDSFRHPFAYMAYDEKGNRMRLTTGPGTNRWTTLNSISPFVLQAVLTTEDGKFETHKGLTLPEMKRAIQKNLAEGGMFHGASTITMQLAKNLFLSRERTLKRKLEELFYTWYLESQFTKDEILELYLNVIEFGPSIYGIGEAARHYFGREPFELNLAESVFLVKLLPNPVVRHKVYESGRTLSPKQLASIQRVMRIMKSRGRITDEELQQGLHQSIVFYKEGDPLPEARLPVYRENAADLLADYGYNENKVGNEDDAEESTWEQGDF